MTQSTKSVSSYLFFYLVAVAMVGASCRHYQLTHPSHPNFKTIAIGPIENQTNEPRLTLYTKQKLSELIMLDGSLKFDDPSSADHTLNANILSYDMGGIGEVQIDSDDKDLRKFRSSIFRVTVNIEYSVLGLKEASSQQIFGTAEFSELVDMDIVKKDGLRRAVYDACSQIVNSLVDPW